MTHRIIFFLDIIAWIGLIGSLVMLGFIVYFERTYPGSKWEKRDKENGAYREYYYWRYTVILISCAGWIATKYF